MADNTTSAPALAGTGDIAKVWRPLTDAETTRANGLIEFVARAVRRQWPDVDGRIAAGTLRSEDVTDVVVWTVLPMLSSDPSVPYNAKSYQQSSGSKSLQVTLGDGAGTIASVEFAGWMVDVFDESSTTGDVWPRSRFRAPAAGRYEGIGFEWSEEPRRPGARDAARD